MVVAVRAEAVITAQDKLRPGLASAAKALEKFRRDQSKAAPVFAANQMLNQQTALLRRAAVAVGGVMAAGKIKEAVVRGADVDRDMRRAAITGEAVEGRIASATAEVRQMALDTAQPVDRLREGLNQLVAAGYDFETSMKALPAVARTAQASGAAVSDIASTTTAMMDNFGVSASRVEAAYDILAKGGKMGKFELKDMARYLPSMLPAAKALGLAGEDGLAKVVAMLQVIRAGTGTAEEAAASANNIFAKMESEETANKFKKMGVDLRKEMEKARKEGKDLLSAFVDISNKALKGDISKLPQLFQDMEFARGMRALLTGKGKIAEFEQGLKQAAGTIDADFNRVIKDVQANIDRMTESADRAKSSFGMLVGKMAEGPIKTATDNLQSLARHLEEVMKVAEEAGNAAAGRKLVQPILNEINDASGDRARIAQEIRNRTALVSDADRKRRLDEEIAALSGEPSAAVKKNPAMMDMRARRLAGLRAERGDLRGAYPAALSRVISDEAGLPGVDQDWVRGELERMREDSRYAAFESARAEAMRPRRKPEFGPAMPTLQDSKGAVLGGVNTFEDGTKKAEALKDAVSGVGDAGQTAGQKVASGLTSGLAAAEAAVAASVARMQTSLNSLKAPNLGGVGGFNTGKSMAEVRQ